MPSTVIRDYDYDDEAGELTIQFTTGRVYIYFGVSADAFAAFANASSRGRHFNRYIRDAYRFREVTPT